MTNQQLIETHPYIRNNMLNSYETKVQFWSNKLAAETRSLRTASEPESQRIQVNRKRSIDALLNAQSQLKNFKEKLASIN